MEARKDGVNISANVTIIVDKFDPTAPHSVATFDQTLFGPESKVQEN